MKIQKIAFAALLAVMFLPTFAFSQACTEADAVSNADALANVSARCCSKGTDAKRRACIRKQISRVGKTRAAMNTEFVANAVSTLKDLRSASCDASLVAAVCSDTTEVTQTEMLTRLDGRCCGKRLKTTRRSCLKAARSKINRASVTLGETFLVPARQNIKSLLASAQCGQGGEEESGPQCGSRRGNSDGEGGFVYKPVSEGDGNLVVLLPSFDSPSSCEIFSGSSKVDTLSNVGRTNGNRPTFRSGKRCSSLPNNATLKCGSVCYSIPSSCQRYD